VSTYPPNNLFTQIPNSVAASIVFVADEIIRLGMVLQWLNDSAWRRTPSAAKQGAATY